MIERKRARARWFNVYLKPDGGRSRSREQETRLSAQNQADTAVRFNQRKLLYRIRVRRYLEPKI